MAVNRRAPRGGPVPAGGTRTADGARLVTPATSKAEQQRMREALMPSRPSSVRIRTERLNIDFFRDAWNELKKVHWPTPLQARNLTALVIAVSVSVGIILGGMDFLLSRFFQFILQSR